MKNPTFVISMVAMAGFLLSALHGEKLLAQAQTPPLATCSLVGPSIADTLKYINSALTDSHKGSTTVLSTDGDHISVLEYSEGSAANSIAPIYALQCPASGSGSAGVFGLTLSCRTGHCVHISYGAGSHGPWDIMPAGDLDAFAFYLHTDDDHGQRFVRALSHLIALLQQQYKQTHSDPNDPFAKP